ncbi:DnaJ domain-containing protein [Sphingomonas aurantiaca]|uniref:DnaJ domain-containing protein n=1 Tax=Sphingomonas aurantiaca TaxID=185949 RepID=UPI002FE2A08A
MSQRDFYQVLGVLRTASSADIRTAFVRLAKHHHPDHAGDAGDLPGRLQEAQYAYRCLSDERARAAHDRALDDSERLHFARQRRVQRRLHRFDGRHPHARPRPQPNPQSPLRRIRWLSLLVATVSMTILARLLTLFG